MARNLEQDVTAFVALIDKWLLLRGTTYTVNQPEQPATIPSTAGETQRDDIPSFVHSTVSLTDLLKDQEREVKLDAELLAQIKQSCNDEELLRETQTRLEAEFAALSPPQSQARIDNFARCQVSQQVAILRRTVAEAALPPCFEVLVITTIQPNGQVDDMLTIYPPKDVTWFNFTVSIRTATTSWQSAEAGFPAGYSIREGGWLYQIAHHGQPAKPVYPLKTAADFESMCETVDKADTTVLIWHERIYKESEARQEEHAKIRDRRSEYIEDEPLNADGTPLLDPFFDDYDWSGIDFTEEMEEHRRTYGLPEWQSDDGEDAVDEG